MFIYVVNFNGPDLHTIQTHVCEDHQCSYLHFKSDGRGLRVREVLHVRTTTGARWHTDLVSVGLSDRAVTACSQPSYTQYKHHLSWELSPKWLNELYISILLEVVFLTYEVSFLASRRLLHKLGELGQGSTGGSRSRDSSWLHKAKNTD